MEFSFYFVCVCLVSIYAILYNFPHSAFADQSASRTFLFHLSPLQPLLSSAPVL